MSKSNGTFTVHEDTPDKVLDIITKAYKNKTRLRLFYGDNKTGKDWMEEYSIIGYINRTNSKNSIPILLNNINSQSGPDISLQNIVKITHNCNVMYVHPKYNINVDEEEYTKLRSKFFLGKSNTKRLDNPIK